MRQWLRMQHGAGPLHFFALACGLAFGGYLVWIVLPAPNSTRILIWAGSAAILHDLVLWPLYTALDRVAARAGRHNRFGVPWVNYVRVPVVLSAVFLTVSFPLVLRHSEPAYHTATGLTENPYLGRWLLLSGGAFAASAVLYVVRSARSRLSR
jgi:hypothetical protein